MRKITKRESRKLLKDEELLNREKLTAAVGEGLLKIIEKDPDFKRRVLEAALLDPGFEEKIVKKLRDANLR